jgi:hypothetical protein
MNKSNLIISGAAAMVALVGIGGLAFSSAFAQDTSLDNERQNNEFIAPGQFRAGGDCPLTDEERQARWGDMDARRAAIESAVEAGDYQAFAKAVGEEMSILDYVNEGNFDRFQEAHNLRQQAREIMEEELGIERGSGMGLGTGKGMGRHGGMGMRGLGMK